MRFFYLLITGWTFLSHGAIPNLTISRTGSLFFAAADLTTNGVPGLDDGASRSVVSSIPSQSQHGGQLTVVNTQVWARHLYGPGAGFAAGLAVGRDGRVSIGASSGAAGYNFVTVNYATDGTPLWTNRYDAPALSEAAWYVAVDGAGNTFVAGEEGIGLTWRNIVTIKYAPNGTALWTNIYNETGTNYHQAAGLATDTSGNVAVALNTFDGSPGYFTTLKYAANGTSLWTNRHRASPFSSDVMSTLGVDPSGNIVVTGGDFLTFQYSPEGIPLWTNKPGGNAVSIAFDHQGNTLVCGDTFSGGHRYATFKWSPLGTPLWTNYMTAPVYQGGYVPQVFVDGGDNVLVLGGTAGAGAEDTDLTLSKLSREGVLLWTNRHFEAGIFETPRAIAVDSAGCLSFAVRSRLAGSDDYDFLTLKFRADGTLFSSNRFSAGLLDEPHALGVSEAGHVYVAGRTDAGLTTVKYVEYIHYTPPPNFVGTDTFTFVATDASGNRAINTVTVNVEAGSLWFNLSRSNLRVNGGTPRLHLDGALAGWPVILYASPDLASWTAVATNVPANGAVELPVTLGGDRQFYRAVQTGP